MAVPTIGGFTSTTISGNASTFDVRPDYHVVSGAAYPGDWIVAIFSSATNVGGTNIPTPPGGWTTIVSFTTVGSGTMCFGVYAHRREVGETAYTWSQTTGLGQTNCRMIFVHGAADIGSWVLGAFDYRQNTGTTTTNVAASITTTATDSLALILGGERTLASETDAQVTFTNSTKFYYDDGSDHILVAATKDMPTPGATGSVTITFPNTHSFNGIAGILGIPPVSTMEPISWMV